MNIQKYLLCTLGGGAVFLFLLAIFAGPAEPKSQTSSPASSRGTDTTSFASSRGVASSTDQPIRPDNSDISTGWEIFETILGIGLIGGVGVYMARGGRPFILHGPWEIF